jgi:hypothetical protein
MITAASFITDFWNDQLVEHGRQYMFLLFVGFLGSFVLIRLSTRLMRSPRVPWWPGSIESGGLHVHHLVFGIVLMMAAGVLGYALFDTGFWYEVSALLFGIGIGLTIDEFALWLYLRDVYWAEEGRSSVDATLIAVALMGLILLGGAPFQISTSSPGLMIATVAITLLLLGSILACLAKGRAALGIAGLFAAPAAVWGACRVGKPGSPWARRFYGERNSTKQAKAEHRFAPGGRSERLWTKIRDAVGGLPEDQYDARVAARAQKPNDT